MSSEMPVSFCELRPRLSQRHSSSVETYVYRHVDLISICLSPSFFLVCHFSVKAS